MWAQWLERTLNAHDAEAYAARHVTTDEQAERDDEMPVDAMPVEAGQRLAKSAADCVAG